MAQRKPPARRKATIVTVSLLVAGAMIAALNTFASGGTSSVNVKVLYVMSNGRTKVLKNYPVHIVGKHQRNPRLSVCNGRYVGGGARVLHTPVSIHCNKDMVIWGTIKPTYTYYPIKASASTSTKSGRNGSLVLQVKRQPI